MALQQSAAVALVDAILATSAGDVVGIFDTGFHQVFEHARPLRAEIMPRARLLDHPLESGQLITDYKIINPVEISMPVIISSKYYRDTYQQIWTAWQNSDLFLIQTRANNYINMVISELPHDEKPDMYGVITMHLRFRQVQVVQSNSSYAPVDPTQTDTVALGEQSPLPVTPVSTISTTSGAVTANSGVLYSSVNPNDTLISGVQTINGVQTISGVPQAASVPVSGVQAITSGQTIQSSFNTNPLDHIGIYGF